MQIVLIVHCYSPQSPNRPQFTQQWWGAMTVVGFGHYRHHLWIHPCKHLRQQESHSNPQYATVPWRNQCVHNFGQVWTDPKIGTAGALANVGQKQSQPPWKHQLEHIDIQDQSRSNTETLNLSCAIPLSKGRHAWLTGRSPCPDLISAYSRHSKWPQPLPPELVWKTLLILLANYWQLTHSMTFSSSFL